MEPSVERGEASEKEEEEENPEEEEEEVPASTSLPMDIDATEDYLQFIEELGRHPGGQTSVPPDSPEDPFDRRSVN
ncbi:hypothetical protein PIB30_090642 [Stylosanthes scabra]|uniref:Uncharacterized protein n=1 Tax=Stylosanthes scabra TaxID=79078 RepID=A0ABU6TTT0_9FABA|nr:hypothetical protein [Stylosanthes scabra]